MVKLEGASRSEAMGVPPPPLPWTILKSFHELNSLFTSQRALCSPQLDSSTYTDPDSDPLGRAL